jgi:uncharacterized membrane protein
VTSAAQDVDRPSRVGIEKRQRLEWLDLYRGIAVLVMIEAHVVNAFLSNAGWPVEWRVRLDYVNGLVAPAFLFIAGYSFGLSSLREVAARPAAAPRLVRLAGIAALGYAMHLPWAELGAGQWSDALRLGTRMDILPCLAGAIAMLVVISRFNPRWTMPLVSALMAATIFAAPRAAEWTGPAPLVAMFNQSTGSFFPLLPWAAFAFAGFSMRGNEPRLAAFALPVLASAAAVFVLGRADLSPVSAAFFFERLAWILVLVPVCGWVAAVHSPRLVLFAGRQSLALYVVHLLLISLLERLGWTRLGAIPTVALLAAIMAVTFLAAGVWQRLSVARADRARRAAHRRESSAPAA